MNTQKLITIHNKPAIQEGVQNLPLLKDQKNGSLIKYIKLTGKILF
jgi:hypothetical protein